MTIKTFSNHHMKNSKQRFKKYLKKSFKEIEEAEVKHLIIDLRNNGGGDDGNIIDLFSQLYDKPFILYENLFIAFKKLPNKKLYENKMPLLNLFWPLLIKRSGKNYEPNWLNNERGLKKMKPAKIIYSHNLYVLTNGRSYSASGFFSGLVKNYERGIFIGEELGGNPVQCTAGSMITLQLPNTKVRVTTPLVLHKMNVDIENTGHGVIPDFPIKASIDDVLNERDVVMDFTLKLIKNTKEIPTSKTSLTH